MRRRFFLSLPVILALMLAGCERDELIGVDPDATPGPPLRTFEALLDASLLDGWVDTVFGGFSNAGAVGYIQVEDGTPVATNRGLIRFGIIEDSLTVSGVPSAALAYDSARIVILVDSSQSAIASAGTVLQLVELEQEWDVSATWELAVDSAGASIPWTGGPGGSLGQTILSQDTLALIVTDTTSELPDSLVFWLGEASDSLLKLWADTTQSNTGFAVVVADSGRVRLFSPRIEYNIIPEIQPDTAVAADEVPTADTFIFDQTVVEDVSGLLRVGGIDGWRPYIMLEIPDSVPVIGDTEIRPLRGATINKAELVLTSLEPPPPPFAAELAFQTSVFKLAADFRDLGVKTPVGDFIFGGDVIIDPDSVDAGSEVRINLSLLVQGWANAPADSVVPLRFTIRPAPEGATFGFWEFGASDGDPAFAPLLRIVFTPPVGFGLP